MKSHVSERAKMRLFKVGSPIFPWRDRLSIPSDFPPLLATSTGIDGGGVTGGVVLHSTLSFPPSFQHQSPEDRPARVVSRQSRTG